jgi:hypothetical protein
MSCRQRSDNMSSHSTACRQAELQPPGTTERAACIPSGITMGWPYHPLRLAHCRHTEHVRRLEPRSRMLPSLPQLEAPLAAASPGLAARPGAPPWTQGMAYRSNHGMTESTLSMSGQEASPAAFTAATSTSTTAASSATVHRTSMASSVYKGRQFAGASSSAAEPRHTSPRVRARALGWPPAPWPSPVALCSNLVFRKGHCCGETHPLNTRIAANGCGCPYAAGKR